MFIKFRLQCPIQSFLQVWSRTWHTYLPVIQIFFFFLVEPKIWTANKEIHIFADHVRVDYFSLLHCSWIRRTMSYCYSLMVWTKSAAANLTYCKIFENFKGSYLTCSYFWTWKGAAKASLLIPWQCCACMGFCMLQTCLQLLVQLDARSSITAKTRWIERLGRIYRNVYFTIFLHKAGISWYWHISDCRILSPIWECL